jgi:hypothetical protein
MGCLLLLIALFSPRLALIAFWLLTNVVDRAFHGVLVPLIGLIFLPLTTLAYVLAYHPVRRVSGWGWALVLLALLLDLGAYGRASRYRRYRRYQPA